MPEPAPKRSRYLVRVVIYFALFALFVTFTGGLALPAMFEAVFSMLVGWAPALVRLISAASPAWSSVILFASGTIIILLLANSLLRWFMTQRAKLTGVPAAWSLRRSCLIAATWGVIVCSAMAITGAIHQMAWAANRDDKWLQESYLSQIGPIGLFQNIRFAALSAEFNPEGTVARLEEFQRPRGTAPPEAFRISFIPDMDGQLAAVVVTSYDFVRQEKRSGWILAQPVFTAERVNAEDFESVLAKLSESSLPAEEKR